MFCQLIKKSRGRVLDVGCGPGNITKYLLSKRPDYHIEGIDMAPNMIKLAKENNPTAAFQVMDCRELDTITKKFDGIISGFCVPYLSKEECLKMIKDCALLLNEDGVLYLSTIEGDYEKSGYETDSKRQLKMFVYYHPEKYLREALEKNHFEVINLQRKDYPQPGKTWSAHMIFIAQKSVSPKSIIQKSCKRLHLKFLQWSK